MNPEKKNQGEIVIYQTPDGTVLWMAKHKLQQCNATIWT